MNSLRQYMNCSNLVPSDGFDVRKEGNEAYINKRAVALAGGIEACTQRLVAVWLAMPEHYRGVGWSWYDVGHEFACVLSQTYGFTVWQIAQVIAVLSPQNPWDGRKNKLGEKISDGNQLCTVKVIKAFVEGGPDAVKELKGWGYAGMFTSKAIRVLQGEELDWSGAPKTHRFALLLANPERLDIAVCDSHASRIATGNLGDRYHVVASNGYPLLETSYMNAATILGIPAYVLQAGTWQFAVDGNLYGKVSE